MNPLDTPPTEALMAAYRAAHYLVCTEVPFTLRIDTPCMPLAALHASHAVGCSSFITAVNPGSERLGAAENARRLRILTRAVNASGWRWIAGMGRDPQGHWPDEPSLLVLGASLEWARETGAACGQNAIVWAAEDAIPRLIALI